LGGRRCVSWPRNEKDYSVKLNRKAKAKALASVLSKKLADAEIVLVDSIAMTEPKAAQAKLVIKSLATASGQTSLATKRKNAAVVILPARNIAVEKSFRNFGNIEVVMAKDVNPVDLLTYKYVVMAEPNSTLEVLQKRVVGTVATK
jgi:large subunit ribosomal protein L4